MNERMAMTGAVENQAEKTLDARIAEAESIEALFAVLDAERQVMGTGKTYSALMLKTLITEAREATKTLNSEALNPDSQWNKIKEIKQINDITRTGGLRDKVVALLRKELVAAEDFDTKAKKPKKK